MVFNCTKRIGWNPCSNRIASQDATLGSPHSRLRAIHYYDSGTPIDQFPVCSLNVHCCMSIAIVMTSSISARISSQNCQKDQPSEKALAKWCKTRASLRHRFGHEITSRLARMLSSIQVCLIALKTHERDCTWIME